MNSIKRINKKEGFSLIGVLGAAFIALLVITALLSMISQIFALGRVSKNKFVAVNLAKEGIELVRNMRDSNWLNYPDMTAVPPDTTPVTKMKWRGEDPDTAPCDPNLSTAECIRLRSLCDGGPYTVDALDDDLILGTGDTTLKQKLYGGAKVFTHQTGGTDSNPIFSRSITIASVQDGEIPSAELLDYLPVLGCGEEAIFVAGWNANLKPRGIIVTSRVTWKDAGTGADKEVELKGRLYDWKTQRP